MTLGAAILLIVVLALFVTPLPEYVWYRITKRREDREHREMINRMPR